MQQLPKFIELAQQTKDAADLLDKRNDECPLFDVRCECLLPEVAKLLRHCSGVFLTFQVIKSDPAHGGEALQ